MTDAQQKLVLDYTKAVNGSENEQAAVIYLDIEFQGWRELGSESVFPEIELRARNAEHSSIDLKERILYFARKGNFHDNTLKNDDLIAKIEIREKVKWETLTGNEACHLLGFYRDKAEAAQPFRPFRRFGSRFGSRS